MNWTSETSPRYLEVGGRRLIFGKGMVRDSSGRWLYQIIAMTRFGSGISGWELCAVGSVLWLVRLWDPPLPSSLRKTLYKSTMCAEYPITSDNYPVTWLFIFLCTLRNLYFKCFHCTCVLSSYGIKLHQLSASIYLCEFWRTYSHLMFPSSMWMETWLVSSSITGLGL